MSGCRFSKIENPYVILSFSCALSIFDGRRFGHRPHLDRFLQICRPLVFYTQNDTLNSEERTPNFSERGEMQRTHVPHDILSELERDVRYHRSQGEYRPTAVAIARDVGGRVLLLRSAKGERPWGLLQGKVEKGESLIRGLRRELREEANINASEVLELCYVNHLKTHGRRRDGFTKGKRYYYFHVACLGFPSIRLQFAEVCDYRWLWPRQTLHFIAEKSNARPEKRESMIRALRIALCR